MSSTGTPTRKEIDTRQWRKEDWGVPVDFVTVSGITMGISSVNPNDNTQKLVHWRAGLAYSVRGGNRSTSLDTLKTTDPYVQIQFISKNFWFSTMAVNTLRWDALKPFTSMDIYNLIKAKGYHRYIYNSAGSGCQFWTRAIIRMLAEEGYIESGAVGDFDAAISETRNQPNLWVPDDDGTFY